MRFKYSKLYFVISSLFIGVLLIGTINFGLSFVFSNKYKETLSINNNFSNSNEVDASNFFRSNSVSLSIIKNSYSKISGTAWIKSVTNNECTFITNLHVLSSILKYDEKSKKLSLDHSSFSEFNIKYFLNPKTQDNKIGRARIEEKDISIKLNKNTLLLEREIPNKYDCDNIVSRNGKTFITNGYIDYVEFKYLIPNNKDDYHRNYNFNNWLKMYDRNMLPKFIQYNNIINDDIYIAGWPQLDNKLCWTERKINLSSSISKITTAIKELEWGNWLKTNNNSNTIELNVSNKKVSLRNIAKQLVIKDLQLGRGSSGSMVVQRNKATNSFEVIGIWWGTYGSNNGAIDLLWTNKYNPYLNTEVPTGWENIIWEGYNVNS